MNRGVYAACAGLLLVYVAEKLKRQNRRKRICWTKPWLLRRDEGRGVLNMVSDELKEEEPILYKNYLRMTDENFEELLEMIRTDITKEDTNMREAISAQKRLSKINLSPEKVEYIVQATVALHNFLAAKNRSAYIGSEEELTTLRHVRNSFSNRTAASVLKVREELTQYFVENDG